MRAWFGALFALAAACGDPAAPPETSLTRNFLDPVGDTVAAPGQPTVRATDAIRTWVLVRPDTIIIRIEFAEPITPWSQELPNGIDGFLDLDLDENAATGVAGAGDAFGGSAQLGAEYYLDFRDDGEGTIDLVEPTANTRRPVLIGFNEKVVEVWIPRHLLTDPDGEFRFAFILETLDRPVSDFVPNQGNYRVSRQ